MGPGVAAQTVANPPSPTRLHLGSTWEGERLRRLGFTRDLLCQLTVQQDPEVCLQLSVGERKGHLPALCAARPPGCQLRATQRAEPGPEATGPDNSLSRLPWL